MRNKGENIVAEYKLLKQLCNIHAPSGNESAMTSFLLKYINRHKKSWKVIPEICYGGNFQNSIVLEFGKPNKVMYAHIDNIGFMARYKNELIKIGGPKVEDGYRIYGEDSEGKIYCSIQKENEKIFARYNRTIDPGTDFSFECKFRETSTAIQSCYLDNRLGVYVALETAKTLENGVIVFSTWEEHGGGSVSYITGYIFKKFGITRSLICDITWVTDGVKAGKGVVVSVRDSGIPRRLYINEIRSILDKNKIKYQLEVESSGGSDGNEIQKSPYPVDWCFVGAPEDFVHSPDEKVHKKDIKSMIKAYKVLMKNL